MGRRRFTAPETRDQISSAFIESIDEGKKVNEFGEGDVEFVIEAKRDSRPDSRMPFSSGPDPPRLTPLEPSSSMQDPSQSRGNQAQDTTLWPRPPADYGSNLLVSSGLQPECIVRRRDHYRQEDVDPSDHETQVAAPKMQTLVLALVSRAGPTLALMRMTSLTSAPSSRNTCLQEIFPIAVKICPDHLLHPLILIPPGPISKTRTLV
jgi:hypothetical protein